MTEHLFRGIHILGELYGISPHLLQNSEFLKEELCKGIKASGATLCSWQVKEFEPGGLTILALLSESHASIHTYPEFESLFLDAFTCGVQCHPEEIAFALVKALRPKFQKIEKLQRGIF